jgi:hypothetical protein
MVAQRFGRTVIDRIAKQHALCFFSKARQLLIEKDNKLTTYDSGDHQISGVQQSGGGSDPAFTSQNGSVNLGELRKIS